MTKAEKSRKKQADDILRAAEARGVESNFFFTTTFQRYQTQLLILDKLEAEIRDGDAVVSKEYVKGRANMYANPAVAEFNRTTDSANKTVSTLLRIISSFGAEKNDEEEDPLLRLINGDGM